VGLAVSSCADTRLGFNKYHYFANAMVEQLPPCTPTSRLGVIFRVVWEGSEKYHFCRKYFAADLLLPNIESGGAGVEPKS
jgi:hypothetical protein